MLFLNKKDSLEWLIGDFFYFLPFFTSDFSSSFSRSCLSRSLGLSVQSLSRVLLFATPWIAARQASLSITNSRSLLKFMPIESVMPSSHLILCRPLLLLPPIPASISPLPLCKWLHRLCTVVTGLSFSLINNGFSRL